MGAFISLVERGSCANCARGEGRTASVLTVSYRGDRTRQLSVRRERVAEVRPWLDNYQRLKKAIEAICDLNHEFLKPERPRKPGRKRRG